MAINRAQLRSQIRVRADMVYSISTNFVQDSEIDDWLVDAVRELYDLVVQVHPDHFVTQHTATLPSTGIYTPQSDYYRLRSVEDLTASSTRPPTVPRYSRTEKSRSGYAYRDRGAVIEFVPASYASGRQVLVEYVPTAPVLTDDVTSLNTTLEPWKEFLITEVAAKCCERDKDLETAAALRERKKELRDQLVAMIPEDVGQPEQLADPYADPTPPWLG